MALLGLDFAAPEGAAILMYHSIGDYKIFFNVKPENFRWQMDWIRQKGYGVISLRELTDKISRKEKLPAKTIVLTFDDSFEETYFNVLPVLKEHSFPATVFVATDFIGREQKNESTGILFQTLRWEQIKEMHSSGLIDFEPHGCSHRELPSISLLEAKSEILNSRKIMEDGLGKKCHFFAYPRGKYNQEIVNILKENNFSAALTVNPGRARNGSDLLKLPRQSIDGSTGMFHFFYKIR